jgi:carbon monoxide dehydrogenase subunit G
MARETFDRRLAVAASPEDVWSTVTDVDKVASWVSVVGAVEVLEPLARYTAVLADRLGPFSLKADLDVTVTDIDPGRSISFRAEGEDRQVSSRIQVAASMELVLSDNGTDVSVSGFYEVGGRVAALGSSTVRSKASKILDEFFSAAERELGG